jgi:hypothetical protein
MDVEAVAAEFEHNKDALSSSNKDTSTRASSLCLDKMPKEEAEKQGLMCKQGLVTAGSRQDADIPIVMDMLGLDGSCASLCVCDRSHLMQLPRRKSNSVPESKFLECV